MDVKMIWGLRAYPWLKSARLAGWKVLGEGKKKKSSKVSARERSRREKAGKRAHNSVDFRPFNPAAN